MVGTRVAIPLGMLALTVAGLGGYVRKRKGIFARRIMMKATKTIAMLLAVGMFLGLTGTARATITPADITAWYGLAGDATDNSGNGYDGTNSGATFVADVARGTVASFDGASSKIDVSASGYSITEHPEPGQFSIGFWMPKVSF